MRKPRAVSEADLYHVVSRGTGRQIIFEDDEDRMRFLNTLKGALRETGSELYAWCLMSNHVHLLVHAPLDKLPELMRRTLAPYAIYFNEKCGRMGHLFQERYGSEPINDDAYLLTVVRYIHQNPVKAGLGAVDDYPWSSYGEFIRGKKLCQTSLVLDMLGGAEGFARFHAVESAESCLDVSYGRNATRAMPDRQALAIAAEVLHPCRIEDLKGLDVGERNARLRDLKESGLTIKQIERLTGIGRSAVQRA